MVLTTSVLAFVNIASTVSLSGRLDEAGSPLVGEPLLSPEHSPTSDSYTVDVPVVSVAAALQWQWSAVGILVAGALAGVLGWLLARRVLRPIEHITATTRRVSAVTLHERISLKGPDDEVRRLACTIDELLDRLEASFESQRRFIAHASHELRTPLTVQRAVLQVGLGPDASPSDVAAVREDLLTQNRRTEALVEALLVLAEAERGFACPPPLVSVADVAENTLQTITHDAERAGVLVVPDIDTTVRIPADPILLQQLLQNLIDNAVEYNRPGGRLWLTVDSEALNVVNCGESLDGETVSTLTAPFQRGTRDRNSPAHHGLGLSIVAAIADAHGWALHLAARAGGGLCVTVRWGE